MAGGENDAFGEGKLSGWDQTELTAAPPLSPPRILIGPGLLGLDPELLKMDLLEYRLEASAREGESGDFTLGCESHVENLCCPRPRVQRRVVTSLSLEAEQLVW